MNTFFAVVIIGFVLMMVIFNVYFRYKILGDYKYLVKHNIQFGAKHIISNAKLESEIIPSYPQHETVIRSFCKKLQMAFRVALGLLFLIIVVSIILKYIV